MTVVELLFLFVRWLEIHQTEDSTLWESVDSIAIDTSTWWTMEHTIGVFCPPFHDSVVVSGKSASFCTEQCGSFRTLWAISGLQCIMKFLRLFCQQKNEFLLLS